MRVAIFSARKYERTLLDQLNARHKHELIYFDGPPHIQHGISGGGFPGVSVSVVDSLDGDVLKRLAAGDTKLIATRSTGLQPY
jgi:D-lactate dehydrogenase